jgi:Fe-S cluster biogenesis protein NfuA/nitrite reductase/ring-hydroxylating ferredoxin subunit
MAGTTDLDQVSARVEELVQMLGSDGDQRVRALAEELVHQLMELYGDALRRVVEIVGVTGQPSSPVATRLLNDELISSLLILHGLHPEDTYQRVTRALDKVRPYLGSHAGGVELLGIDDQGKVHLRLQGSCDGCPSSAATVRFAIERAIGELAPEVVGVEVEGRVEPAAPGLLQIAGPGAGPSGKALSNQVRLPASARPLPGRLARVEAGGADVLLASIHGHAYAYRDRCPVCASSLESGDLEGSVLRCLSCGTAYDLVAAGRALERAEHLEPLPLIEDAAGLSLTIPQVVG